MIAETENNKLQVTTETALEKPARITQFNQTLQRRLVAYKEANSFKNSDLVAQLGYGNTQVSKYLNGKPDWDVARFEQAVEDVLRNASRRKEIGLGLFENSLSNLISGTFENIRETNDIGLVVGPAGIGKTSGCDIYCVRNITALMVTATQWDRTEKDVIRMLFNQIPNSDWSGYTKKADFLVTALKNSNRLIIIDNAHKLNKNGRAYLFDFHDLTGCPIAFVGNPELLDKIRENDQQFSRIGILQELSLRPNEAKSIAAKVAQQIDPECAGEIVEPLLETIGEERGHFRAVRKQVVLARKIRRKTGSTVADSIRTAHTKLVRDYKL